MPDFKTPHRNDAYYDLFEDYDLIESSFAQQYGIRLRNENAMSFSEFSVLLAGLNAKTPLGAIVTIRAEKDPKIIKEFTREQKEIHNRWKFKQSKQMTQEEYNNAMRNLEEMFKNIGSKK